MRAIKFYKPTFHCRRVRPQWKKLGRQHCLSPSDQEVRRCRIFDARRRPAIRISISKPRSRHSATGLTRRVPRSGDDRWPMVWRQFFARLPRGAVIGRPGGVSATRQLRRPAVDARGRIASRIGLRVSARPCIGSAPVTARRVASNKAEALRSPRDL